MKKPYWQGVFPAITTQLKRDQSLDLEATARHVEALIDSGVAGIIFLGSLGENQALRLDEKRRYLQAMVEAVNGRVPPSAAWLRAAPPRPAATRATPKKRAPTV